MPQYNSFPFFPSHQRQTVSSGLLDCVAEARSNIDLAKLAKWRSFRVTLTEADHSIINFETPIPLAGLLPQSAHHFA